MNRKLLLLLVCSMTAVCGFAQTWDCGDQGNNVIATLSSGTLTISGTGAMKDYVHDYFSPSIPWYGVRAQIKQVEIKQGVASIGNYAFYSCSGLTSITIPSSVKSIGDSAFSGTSWYNNQPNGVIYINQVLYVYKGTMPANTVINIDAGTVSISSHAFSDCSGLTSVTIPSSVTSIGDSAFAGCSKLKKLIIEDDNSTLAFYCSNSYPPTNEVFTDCPIDTVYLGRNISYDKYTYYNFSPFYNKTTIKNLTIGNSVTNLDGDFGGCSNIEELSMNSIFTKLITANLQKLIIRTGCTSIPAGSLSACNNLKEVALPFIGTSPVNPSSLSSLFNGSVPATLQKLTLVRSSVDIAIADNALSGCSGLTELTLSSNVKGVGENALYGCSGLRDIYSHWAYPPVAYNNSSFSGVNKFVCKLHVPVGSKQYYSVADGWKEFFSPVDNIEEEAAVTIVARSVPAYGGVVSGLLQYNYDAEAKLTATGNMGYDFQGWMENNQIVSTDNPYTFIVEGSRTLYAIFTPRENADENIQIQTQAHSASISWVAVEDAENYMLIIYEDETRTHEIARFELDVNGNILRSATRDLSCTIPDLDLATAYYYSLTSYDADNRALTVSNGNFTTSASGMDVPFANPIRVYPNPASESFRIGGITGNTAVTVSDISGKIVLQRTVAPDEAVSVEQLPKGMYIVHAAGETVKLVKR